MAIRCEKRDMNLLMSAQGELNWWQNLCVWLHLLTCKSCQNRKRDFTLVSSKLRDSIGGSIPDNGYILLRPTRRASLRTVIVCALLLAVIGASASVLYSYFHEEASAVPPAERCEDPGEIGAKDKSVPMPIRKFRKQYM